MRNYVSLLVLAMVTPPLAAQTGNSPATPSQTSTAAAKIDPLDRVVCRSEETLGSRLKKHKVCATLREWQDQELENRQAAQGMQGVGTGCPEGGGGPGC
jgi:hypothetical protein